MGEGASNVASRGVARRFSPKLARFDKKGFGRLSKRDGAAQRPKEEALAILDKMVKIYQDKD